jgi:hypothetical protein
MAVFVVGTPCGICGRPIGLGDRRSLFPPFVINLKDPLFIFSDGAFHEECVLRHELGSKALRCADRVLEASSPDRFVCAICGDRIVSPDDCLSVGLLTSDESHPAYRFNGLHIHPSEWAEWDSAPVFQSAVRLLQESSEWCGPRLVFSPSVGWVR